MNTEEKTETVDVEHSRQHGTKRKRQVRRTSPRHEPKIKAQKGPNIFQKGWVRQKKYKGWLVPVKSDQFQAKCVACNQKFVCGNNENKVHLDSTVHSENVKIFYASKKIVEGVTSDKEIKVFWHRRDRAQDVEDRGSLLITRWKWNMKIAKCLFELIEQACDDPAVIADVSFQRFTRGALVEEPDSEEVDIEF